MLIIYSSPFSNEESVIHVLMYKSRDELAYSNRKYAEINVTT